MASLRCLFVTIYRVQACTLTLPMHAEGFASFPGCCGLPWIFQYMSPAKEPPTTTSEQLG